MSFTLYFQSRKGAVPEEEVLDYFRDRPNYKIENGQAIYGNDDTGVYFLFELKPKQQDPDEPDYVVTFDINYFRPSYFIKEAEPEVSSFVEEFDWLVHDPQIDGMGEDNYRGDRLVSAWNKSNETTLPGFLKSPETRKDLLTLPTATLTSIWQWNFRKKTLQEEVGEEIFVPRTSIVLVNGRLSTIAVWSDGIPMMLSKVDYLIVYRNELAPRRLFKRAPGFSLLPWDDALALLAENISMRPEGTISFDYARPPKAVAAGIRALKPSGEKPSLIAMDKVLDRELVEMALTKI